MKAKLIETTVTKTYKDDRATYIHTKTKRKPQLLYFSGSDKITDWDVRGAYIDLAPKGNFITRWVKRLWNLKQLERLLLTPTNKE